MKSAKLVLALLITFSVIAQHQDANAQRLKLPFGKSKAESKEQMPVDLSQNSGPWLIMCASFTGEDGRQQARRLVEELRTKHRLNAYVYSHEFDFGDDVANRGLAYSSKQVAYSEGELPRLAKMKLAKIQAAEESRIEETAVLIGDFATIEDARAQRALEAIKTLRPESMANIDSDSAESGTSQVFVGGQWRKFSKKKGEAGQGPSPLRAAFMMPNPLLPDEYFAARKTDEEVMKWNRDTKHSLLENTGVYSVKIATFTGDSTFELDQMQKTEEEDAWRKKNRQGYTESKLANGWKKATVLANHLRKQGIEAYEFHDRHESYVCVGSYDWIAKADERGMKRNNPDMVAMIQKFRGRQANVPGKPGAVQSYSLPKDLAKAGIACDMQPLPVLVPKASSPERTGNRLFKRFK